MTDEAGLGPGARWLIAGLVGLVALPVAVSLYVLGVIAWAGCFIDCWVTDPQPLLAGLLVTGSAGLGGAAAGLVPWALGRSRRAILRTALVAATCVVLLFVLSALDG